MPNYSYRVRVLAALDANASGPVTLDKIESEVQSKCEASRINLPSTWKKWTRSTVDKLVDEGWVSSRGQQYSISSALQKIIREEKERLKVPQTDHEWKTFAHIARRLPSKPEELATPRTPVTRKRRSMAVTVEISPRGLSEGPFGQLAQQLGNRLAQEDGADDTIVVQDAKRRRVRHSDPGVSVAAGGSSSQAASAQRRRSVNTASQTSSSRRRSSGVSRSHRRHTMPAMQQRTPAQLREIPQGVSKEIQFIPLRQVLSARTRRALRRNQLSDEMNNIDEERREGQRRNREELMRLRAEIQQYASKMEDLERQLHLARIAPPSETGSVGPGSVGMAPIYEDEAEDSFSPGGLGSFSTPRTPFRFGSGALTPALRRFQSEGQRESGETPISRRDKKIRDLESQIDVLRRDISDREEEERKRAAVEEQIFMEAMDNTQADMSYSVMYSPSRIGLGNDDEEDYGDDDNAYPPMFPHDDSDVESIKQPDVISVPDSPTALQSSQMTINDVEEIITVKTTEKTNTALLEKENETLQASLEALKQHVEELEETLEDNRSRPEARAAGVQTDSVMDAEKVRMKETIEMLEDKVDVLEQSSSEERHRLWQKIKGHLSHTHSNEGLEELDMAIDEILTNLALIQNTADERHKAFEAAERDLQVERMLAKEKEAELSALQEQKVSLEAQVKKLEAVTAELENQLADFEADEEQLQRELEDQKRELAEEQEELKRKTKELEAAVAEADKLEKDLAELGEVLDEEIAEFPNASKGPLSTILEKLQAFADVVREEKESHEAKVEELTDSIASKEEAIEELQDRLAGLNGNYEELEKMNEKLEALLKERDKEIETLKQELDTLKSQLEEAQKEKEELNGTIQKKDENITSLTNQLMCVTDDLAKIKEKRDDAQKKILELTSELEKKSEEATAHGIKLDSDLAAKNQAITDLEVQLASVNEQYSKLNVQHASTETKVKELSEELARVKEDAEAKLEELNIMLDAKSEKIGDLQEEVKSLGEEVSELTSTIDQLNNDQTLKENQLASLKQLVAEKEQIIDDLQALNGVIERKDKTVEDMLAQIKSLESELGIKSQRLSTVESEVEALKGKVSTQDASLATLEEEINLLKDDLENRFVELESLRSGLSLHDKEISIKQEHIRDLSEEIIALNDTISDKTKEAEDLREEVLSLNNAIIENEGQINALEDEIEELRTALDERTSKIEELEKEVSSLQSANAEKDESVNSLNNRISDLSSTINNRDSTIAVLNREVADRNGVIQANHGTIQSLTGKINDLNKLVETRDGVIENLNGDIADLKDHIASIEDNLASIDKEKAATQKRVKELLQEAAAKDQTIAELEKLYDVVAFKNAEIDSLNDTIENLRNGLASLTERFEATEARIGELLLEMSEKQKTIDRLEIELDASKVREYEANEKYHEALNAQGSLKKQLGEMHSLVDKLRAVVDGHEAALEEKDKEITDLQQKYSNLETTFTEKIAAYEEQLADLRAELEQERDDAVNSVQLKLDDALQAQAELETELESTRAEYKDIIDNLKSKVESLEIDLDHSKGETHQARAEIKSLEEAKNLIIAELQQKVKMVADLKERSEVEFAEQVELKRVALAEKEKELASVELAAQKDKNAMRIELNKQYQEISRLETTITELNEELNASLAEEDRLTEEIQEYEQSTQLLKDEAAKVKAALESHNTELSVAIDALRLELLQARDELKHEVQLHAASVEEKDNTISKLNEMIDSYKDEGNSLRKRISALCVDNEKWRQKYNHAVEDSTAEFDAFQNTLWTVASAVKKRKAEFLERANSRLRTEAKGESSEEQEEQSPFEEGDTSTAGDLLSHDATTNVSMFSPPTPEASQHVGQLSGHISRLAKVHGKRTFRDSGMGVEEEDEDEEVERFESYGARRRGFLTEGH